MKTQKQSSETKVRWQKPAWWHHEDGYQAGYNFKRIPEDATPEFVKGWYKGHFAREKDDIYE